MNAKSCRKFHYVQEDGIKISQYEKCYFSHNLKHILENGNDFFFLICMRLKIFCKKNHMRPSQKTKLFIFLTRLQRERKQTKNLCSVGANVLKPSKKCLLINIMNVSVQFVNISSVISPFSYFCR